MKEFINESSEKKMVLRVSFLYSLYKQSLFFFLITAIIFLSEILVRYNLLTNKNIYNILLNIKYIILAIFSVRIIYGLIYYKVLKYELYVDRLVTQEGVFTSHLNFLELYRVKDYIVYQSFFMKLFGMMNIQLITSDKTSPILNLKGIPKSNVFNLIRKYVEEQRRIKGVREFD